METLTGRLRTRPGWFGRVIIQVEMEAGGWRDADYRRPSDLAALSAHYRVIPAAGFEVTPEMERGWRLAQANAIQVEVDRQLRLRLPFLLQKYRTDGTFA